MKRIRIAVTCADGWYKAAQAVLGFISNGAFAIFLLVSFMASCADGDEMKMKGALVASVALSTSLLAEAIAAHIALAVVQRILQRFAVVTILPRREE